MSVSDVASLVKQTVDIVDVVGQVVPLRRAGHRHVGLCPFHQEKNPSFQVDAENQLYYCFGCGSGGDVLSFVMRYQNVSFGDALRFLADRYHIVLPERDDPRAPGAGAADAARKQREMLFSVLRSAAEFFYRQLHHSPAGKIARDYLQRRQLPQSVVEAEKLGYAAAEWDGLLAHLTSLGVDPELGVAAGLLAKSSKDPRKIYDRFRNRLIFPIVDDQDRVVGFGGRALSDHLEGEPKYLNSPETAVYHKGRMLYQIPRAREACRRDRQVVLVEGYMDLLAFHAQGFYRVTATLGTALTPQQVRILGRMADEVVLAYDGDDAGEKAMMRALPLFLQEEVAVSCIRFPDGLDPDDFLKREGLSGFERLLHGRGDLGGYALGKILDGWDGSSVGKAKVVKELQPLFSAVRQPVLRSEYLRLVSDRLSLSEEVIQRQWLHASRNGAAPSRAPRRRSVEPRAPQAQTLEERIVRLMVHHPELIPDVAASGAVAHFQEAGLKTLAEVILGSPHPPDHPFQATGVYDGLTDPGLQELFTRLLLEECGLEEPRVQLTDWLEMVVRRRIKQENHHLNEALRQADQEGDLSRMLDILSKKVQSLKPPGKGEGSIG